MINKKVSNADRWRVRPSQRVRLHPAFLRLLFRTVPDTPVGGQPRQALRDYLIDCFSRMPPALQAEFVRVEGGGTYRLGQSVSVDWVPADYDSSCAVITRTLAMVDDSFRHASLLSLPLVSADRWDPAHAAPFFYRADESLGWEPPPLACEPFSRGLLLLWFDSIVLPSLRAGSRYLMSEYPVGRPIAQRVQSLLHEKCWPDRRSTWLEMERRLLRDLCLATTARDTARQQAARVVTTPPLLIRHEPVSVALERSPDALSDVLYYTRTRRRTPVPAHGAEKPVPETVVDRRAHGAEKPDPAAHYPAQDAARHLCFCSNEDFDMYCREQLDLDVDDYIELLN